MTKMSDLLSLSVVEANFEQVKWEMAERFTKEAELLYSNNDHAGAYKLCEKVLAKAPEYFPARKLMKKCTKTGKPSGADEQEPQTAHDAQTSPAEVDSHSNNTLEPQPKKTSKKTPKKTVPFWEEETLLLESAKDSPGPSAERPKAPEASRPRKCHSSATSNKLDRGGRREKYLRELLLEGHFFQKQPIEVFAGLKELLWSEDKGMYMCPVPNCNLQFKSRVPCVNHFLVAHLQTDANGVQVKPFVCRACKNLTRFRTLQEVIGHGVMVHPRCQWVGPLIFAMQNEGETIL